MAFQSQLQYEGKADWQDFLKQFEMIAIINGWTDWEKARRPCLVYKPLTEKAGQLATALEEEELQVLPGLGPDKMVNYDVLATALKCSFGRVEPAVGLCQCLATRSHGSGEKQGILAGDVSYLVQRGYPEFLPTTEEDLTICPRPNPNCPAQVQGRSVLAIWRIHHPAGGGREPYPVPPGRIRIVSVGNDSVSLSWGRPSVTMQFSYSYNITYSCSFWDQQDSSNATSESTVVSNLRPGSEYVFNITTVQVNGVRSSPTSISLYTSPSPPEGIRVDFVETNSVSLSWGKPVDMDEIKHSFAITYSCSFWNLRNSTTASSLSIVISNLRPGSEYVFNVTTVKGSGGQSTPASTTLYTLPPPPGKILIDSVESNSVSLSWGSPFVIDGIPHSFNITYSCSFRGHSGSTSAPSNSTVISNLRLGCEYVFSITTVNKGGQSTPAVTSVYIKLALHGEIKIDSVGNDSVSLSWGSPAGMDGVQYSFNITYSCSFWGHNGSTSATSNSTVISNLRPGSKYVFNVTIVQADGVFSTPASISLYTNPAPPGEIALDSVETKLVSLSWATPIGMDDIPHSFNITYFSFYWDHYGSTTATSNSTTISNLRAGSEYVFNITTVQDNGGQSTPASIAIFTNLPLDGTKGHEELHMIRISEPFGEPMVQTLVQ
ncbi:UNVERIFIED_CONTAM: hypothetical protein FKN15_038532 [Acipenser sinensis]